MWKWLFYNTVEWYYAHRRTDVLFISKLSLLYCTCCSVWFCENKFSCIFWRNVFSKAKETFFKFNKQLFFETVQRWQAGWLLKSRNGSFKKVDHTKINENTSGKQDVTRTKKNKKKFSYHHAINKRTWGQCGNADNAWPQHLLRQ